MVVKHMSSREARANFADLLGSVFYTNEAVIVEKKGKPVAVVISPAVYQAWQASATRDRAIGAEVRADNAGRDSALAVGYRSIPALAVPKADGEIMAIVRDERATRHRER
jgi:prevent-host-death family protein